MELTTDRVTTPLDLFPVPRSVVRFDPTARVAGAVSATTDPSLPTQGYELVADDDGIRLVHADDAGRRYGEQTIRQLRGPDGALPHVHLRDGPDVATRAYLLDVSRNRVPTRTTLARLVEVLDRCRFNQLQLYVEHTFAYAGHEDVWGDAYP